MFDIEIEAEIVRMNSKPKTQNSHLTVVIGYGNDLRGDDALGPLAATAVAEWDMPGVQAIAAHQLMPELAEPLAQADLAIFVDARMLTRSSPDPFSHGGRRGADRSHLPAWEEARQSLPLSPAWERGVGGEGAEGLLVQPIEAAASDTALGHTGDPRVLLALAMALYGRCPLAWSITVPGYSFAFGAGLSPAAERGLAAALQQIRDLIASSTCAVNQPQRAQTTQRD
jgi:Ni,Fe-hydrogenase maturation factor